MAAAAATTSFDPQDIVTNFKNYMTNTQQEVMNNPLRSVVYSLGIKVSSIFAFYVSQVASGFILAFSILMIDRVIAINFKNFRTDFLTDLYENPTFKSILGIKEKSKRDVAPNTL
jgi:hypothetical protein